MSTLVMNFQHFILRRWRLGPFIRWGQIRGHWLDRHNTNHKPSSFIPVPVQLIPPVWISSLCRPLIAVDPLETPGHSDRTHLGQLFGVFPLQVSATSFLLLGLLFGRRSSFSALFVCRARFARTFRARRRIARLLLAYGVERLTSHWLCLLKLGNS